MRCLKNADCKHTGWCDRGACKKATKEDDFCKSNSDCPADFQCDYTLQRCKQKEYIYGQCFNSDECPEGFQCTNGTCVMGNLEGERCEYTEDCYKKLSCYNGGCHKRCLKNSQCRHLNGECTWISSVGYKLCMPLHKGTGSVTRERFNLGSDSEEDDYDEAAYTGKSTHQYSSHAFVLAFITILVIFILGIVAWVIKRILTKTKKPLISEPVNIRRPMTGHDDPPPYQSLVQGEAVHEANFAPENANKCQKFIEKIL